MSYFLTYMDIHVRVQCPDNAKDGTTYDKKYKMFFKGSSSVNIIQSLTYIEESSAFQKIKNPTLLMGEDSQKQFEAQLSLQVQLRSSFKFNFVWNLDATALSIYISTNAFFCSCKGCDI